MLNSIIRTHARTLGGARYTEVDRLFGKRNTHTRLPVYCAGYAAQKIKKDCRVNSSDVAITVLKLSDDSKMIIVSSQQISKCKQYNYRCDCC